MNIVKIATVGPRPPVVQQDTPPKEIVDYMIDQWRTELGQVLPEKPDLIVVPEACDRPDPTGLPLDKRLEYYRERGDRIRELFAAVAAEHDCYLVYSAARESESGDGTWRNSSVVIDRKGTAVGVYDKNHLVMEEEHDRAGARCGNKAPIIKCDFGRVACLICFDLNFSDLRDIYAEVRPDLLIFSSMYHGGDVVQSWWAYACRAHWVSAVSRLPCQIRNPYGELIASSTNYRDFAVGSVNLDCCMVHYDFNWEKLEALKKRYGSRVRIHDPGYFGSVLVSSEADEKSAVEMVREFEMELLDEYLGRELEMHRKSR